MRMLKILFDYFAVVNQVAYKPFFDNIFVLPVFLQRSAFQFHSGIGKICTRIVVCFKQKIDIFHHLSETAFTFLWLVAFINKVT